MCGDFLWTIFLYLYSYWAINSEKRKYPLLVPQLFKLISQSPVVGTQAFLYVDPVQMIFIFLIHFFCMTCSQSFLLKNLRMVLPICLFRRYHTFILSPIMSTLLCWSILHTIGWRFLSSIDKGNPAYLIEIFNNRNIWLQLLEVLV